MTTNSDKCPICGNCDVIYKEKGPHIGVYCSKCGRWKKWISKKDLKVNYIEKDPEYESWLKMVTELLEAEDNGQNA